MNMRKRYLSIVLFLFLFAPALSAQFKDAASYGFSPEKSAAENVKALQSAVSGGGTILVSKPGTYDLNDSILLDDNTKLVFGAGVVIRKVAKPRSRTARRALAPKPEPQVPAAEPVLPKPSSEAVAAQSEPPSEPAPSLSVPSSVPAPEPVTEPAAEPVAPPAAEALPPSPSPMPEQPQQPQGRREGRDRRDGRDRREGRREERRDGRRDDRPRNPQPEMGPPTRGLTLLGAKTTVYSDQYTPAILEAFENRHQENDFFVKFNCPEFTSLCPITGQPDFATITISYVPDRKIVESKSLKLYLFSFRNHGAFHEDCVNVILKDLVRLLAPRYIEVWGKFLPRGGLSIDPYANYGRPSTRWEEFARQRLLMHDLNPERVDNR